MMKGSPVVQSTSSGKGPTSILSRRPAGDSQHLPSGRKRDRALGGLLVRRYQWALSLKGKLLIFLVLLAAGLITLFGVYPFLALTKRVDANILVVEGWVHPYAIEAGAEEFRERHYRQIFTTGGPVVGKGGY